MKKVPSNHIGVWKDEDLFAAAAEPRELAEVSGLLTTHHARLQRLLPLGTKSELSVVPQSRASDLSG